MKRVRSLMNQRVETIAPDETVRQAALKMKNWDVGCLIVCRGVFTVGIVTDRDLVLRVAAEGRDPATTRVEEIMSFPLVTCRQDDAVESAAGLLGEQRCRRLPVLGPQRELAGLISLGRLMRAGEDGVTPQILSRILSPASDPQ